MAHVPGSDTADGRPEEARIDFKVDAVSFAAEGSEKWLSGD